MFLQVELFTLDDCEHFYHVQFWKQIYHCVEPKKKEIQKRWKLEWATWGTIEILPKHLGVKLAKSGVSWSWNWWSPWMKRRVSLCTAKAKLRKMWVWGSACLSDGKGHRKGKNIQWLFSQSIFWQGLLSGLLHLVGEGVKMTLFTPREATA